MKTLEPYIEVDPRRVLQLIGTAVKAATEGGGLQFESMACTVYVRCIERYLAEYRYILQEPALETILIQTLDTFVQVSWPDAIRLAYRMDEISRYWLSPPQKPTPRSPENSTGANPLS